MSALVFTPEAFPTAIAGLFRLNGYVVTGPLVKNGGEVDLVAHKPSDLFDDPVYIEATIEHVDNDKFSKDLTKLEPIRQTEPNAKRMIVSARGFTAAVRAKAAASGITALTFTELEGRFQRFEPLLARTFGATAEADELKALADVYEEPNFEDTLGSQPATAWLTEWLDDPAGHPWLIITGEYGTGKTALTRILLRRWLSAYQADSTRPVPFRIESRSFTRQFDVRSLLHNFLDANGLEQLPIDFVFSLIRTGRVALLLDGYDEMAQYMNARERRACLEALAQLSADGARGILTSRPNYFAEAEELQVLEALYADLDRQGRLITEESQLLASEAEVDSLFDRQIIQRVERTLRDLTPEQTEDLISRKLADDAKAREVVLGLLQRIFRSSRDGGDVALSGKPVIITYLLDIADELKDEVGGNEPIGEWQVYDLIVRKLMMRDYAAAPEIMPSRRRQFLQRLALRLSQKDSAVLNEQAFSEFVRAEFDAELRKVPAEARDARLQELATDLRRSATLTRTVAGDDAGFRFSHNSLREFLAAEAMLLALDRDHAGRRQDLPVTQPMRDFAASQPPEKLTRHFGRLGAAWLNRTEDDGAGQLLSLLWTALLGTHSEGEDIVRSALEQIVGKGLDLSRSALEGLELASVGGTSLRKASFESCTLTRVGLSGADLQAASFAYAVLDEVDLAGADLTGATLMAATFADVDLTDTEVRSADFREVDEQFEIRVGDERLSGASALGLLRSRGALTRDVDPIHVLRHHPKYTVAQKVGARLLDGAKHQVRGLTQRGSAQSDPKFAKKFLVLLIADGYVGFDTSRQLVQITDSGRRLLGPFVEARHASPEAEALFKRAL